MKDLGELHFLGMHVRRHGTGLLLSQRQYMLDILERAGMTECKPCSTPVDTNPKLAADGPPVQDASEFRSLAGALQYLTFTRPDIAYAVQQVCLHMHDPREPHLAALKHILRYIRGTLHLGLLLRPSSQSELTVLRCRLGRLSGYSQIHIGLCSVSRGQPGLLVVEAAKHSVQIQC